MKKMKTLASLVLALVLAMALTVPAFADGNDGSITVDNAKQGETYTLYKIFDATYTGTDDPETPNVDERSMNYTVAAGSFWEKKISNNDASCPFQKTTTNSTTYYVTLKNEATSGATVATWLKNNIGEAPTTGGTKTPATGVNSVEWTGLAYGYYYIDTTTGSAVTVNNVAPSVTVEDKNQEPTVTKDFVNLPSLVQVGDTISYSVTIEVKTGAENYVLADTMGAGLQLKANTVKVDNIAVTNTTTGAAIDNNAGVFAATDNGFTFTFNSTYLAGKVGQNIVVTYDVEILDTAAVPNGATITADDTTNSAKVTYGSAQETNTSTKDVDLYWFHLVKVDENRNTLNGATFQLFKSEADAQANRNAIGFTYDASTKTYKAQSEGNANIVVHDGFVKVSGLNGTYYLKETVAPTGYNLKTDITAVTVNASQTAAEVTNGVAAENLGVQVVNQAGAVLPSTGGMGTTLFYTIGGLLVVCSAILIVTKKRMSSMA